MRTPAFLESYNIGIAEVTVLIVTIYFVYKYATRDKRLAHLPPHVRGWPIINQTFAHLEDDPTGNVIGWAKQYGEIFRTTSANTMFIWLNSREAFKELIDRRSAIYSSRHPQPMVLDVASAGKRITFMPYGKDWRALRNIFHRLLTPQMSKSYTPTQTFEAKQLSVDLLDSPEDFYMHNRRYSASVIMQIIYGRRIPTWDCEEIRQIYSVIARFAYYRRPGAFLVDTFPQLADSKLFNLISSWRQEGKQMQELDTAIYRAFWERLKREIKEGTAPHSWGKGFIQSDYQKLGIDELGALYAAGSMIEAGSETTSQALNNTIVGLLSNPDAVKKAHEELDRVIGGDRTPTFEDEKSLPYIRAIVKEILRWRPVNKLGQNHFVTQDDWYKGYFIPKNTIVMLNLWALHHNEEEFPEADKFIPDRFMDYPLTAAEYAAHPDVDERDHFGFGGGRRICPGLHVAEKSLFINIARTLWGFDIKHAKDADGNIVPVDCTTKGLMPGALSNPKPYKCCILRYEVSDIAITVRSPKHERILREEWAAAQKAGVDFTTVQFDKIL